MLGSRACACTLVTAGLTLIVLLALILALLPAAILHGTGGAPNGAWYLSMAAMTLRCVLFTAARAPEESNSDAPTHFRITGSR